MASIGRTGWGMARRLILQKISGKRASVASPVSPRISALVLFGILSGMVTRLIAGHKPRTSLDRPVLRLVDAENVD